MNRRHLPKYTCALFAPELLWGAAIPISVIDAPQDSCKTIIYTFGLRVSARIESNHLMGEVFSTKLLLVASS